jgi:hypothetical protein
MLTIFVVTAVIAYGVYAFYYYSIQRTVIFPRHLVDRPGAGEAQFDGEQLWLSTKQARVETWYLPPYELAPSSKAPVLIFAHANAELIDYWPEHVAGLREMGIGVLLVEFPGYGRSEGAPSQKSLTETFVAAYDLITSRDDVDKDRVAACGISLGGGAACALASKRDVKALILLSSFTSIRGMAGQYFLPSFLILDPFDNLSVVREFKGKVLVIHGTNDEIFPYAMGVELADAASDGRLITYECGHNDCIYDWNAFWREQEEFFQEAGIII